MGAYRFLFTGKWIGSFVLCIIFSIICVYLAGWQMSRKEALDWRNSLIVQNYHATPYSFQDHPTIFQDFDSGRSGTLYTFLVGISPINSYWYATVLIRDKMGSKYWSLFVQILVK